MFISRDWRTKRYRTEVLQCVGERVVGWIAGFPKTVALGKFLRSKGREAE